jgi:hypothetical protein
MGLKFRRGTTAQKSGSLAFGEPYVNTDLGTLQIGGASGDITLGASGTGSAGSFAGISGSSLDITGNAKIDGNLILGGAITIGDNVSDTVNVVASLSSSLIPSTTNTFDLGSATKVWRDLYISTGSIKFVEGSTIVSTLSQAAFNAISGGYITFSAMLNDGRIARTDNTGTNKFTGSQFINGDINLTGSIIPGANNLYDLGSETKIFRDLYISTGSIKIVNPGTGTVVGTLSSNASGDFNTAGAISSSTITGIGNVSLYSSSVANRLVAAESFSSSLDTTFATDASVTIVSASAWGAFQSASSYSASAATDLSSSNAARVALSASVAASGFAVSSSVASATATSITSLSSSVKAVTDTFATSASLASARATDISTISGSVKTVTDAISGRVTTLEGKDISITLTGDVTGTGTITDLANVSFATTIAADSVALGTDTTGNYVATMTAGAGITVGTATGEGSTPVITNTGVTSNVAGTGISVSGGTGAVTITNSGVTSAVAGTGVSVSAGTGAVTFSIGQAVATNSAVTFASVAASGDIVAYSTSDKRHKNNIQLIPNALEKVSKLNGVTWEWNDDVEDVTKLSPKTGLIAQEVQEVLPEVVTERENGFLGLDYSKMVGLLVEAIKEQQTQIAELKAEVEALKK